MDIQMSKRLMKNATAPNASVSVLNKIHQQREGMNHIIPSFFVVKTGINKPGSPTNEL